jgi:single-strand DNA-binding protein
VYSIAGCTAPESSLRVVERSLAKGNTVTELVTISGLVATTPRHLITQDGLPITSFRLAASHRRFDRTANKWVDGETNWFTVTAFRQLAINSAGSVSKGERVLVTGKLRVRDWDNGERAGTSVEIESDAIGHDLTWGTATFTRTILVREQDPAEDVDSEIEDEEELVAAK